MGTCIAQSTKYVSYELKVNLLTNINGVSDTPLNGWVRAYNEGKAASSCSAYIETSQSIPGCNAWSW